MTALRIEIHVEELVLHGFPPLDRRALAEAVQRELAERVKAQLPRVPVSSDALDAGRFDAPPGWDAGALGAGVALQVGGALPLTRLATGAAPSPRDREVRRR